MSTAAPSTVTLELDGWTPPRLGEVHATTTRGRTMLSVTLDEAWLAEHRTVTLDPALQPFGGPQFAPKDVPLLGLLADSSPDRWGRLLMQRRAAQAARVAGQRPRPLDSFDHLLGVHDPQRSGALRVRTRDGRYLADGDQLAAPPWASLRELEHAAWSLDREGDLEDEPEYDAWLRLLVAPGSSLGGARPKAGVVDEHGALWIAKFPSTSDERDMGAWEYVVWRLAREAGIDVPEARLERLSRRHHTFLVKRFDRDGARRIHYASAMTIVGKSDGGPASYLDIAEAIIRYGATPAADLHQLWRRLVFSIFVSNLDDHLRNHGFLLEAGAPGWRLAPAFDQNPSPLPGAHALTIDGEEDANDLALALRVAKYFRVDPATAGEIVRVIMRAVATWEQIARGVGLSRAACEMMAPAFENASR